MAIDIVSETGELEQTVVLPAGARQLGVRVKPIIRLGMGIKDPERGFPRKTDYLTVRGDDRAVAKFYAEYGEKPKAVEILLPSELDIALTIQYRAFKGAAGGEGGTLVAVGHTNFALRDYCGGADVLTVFNQDGSVEEVETAGLDANTRAPLDEAAATHGIELYTTFRAGLPSVLGFGSYFEISSKGKESTDNLWAKLRELYGLFGSRITFAVKPQLVLRPSTARPVVVDKETKTKKRTTTTIYALDIVVPETIDEMIDRLRDRQSALAPAGPVAALYGPAALPAAAAPSTDETPRAGAGSSDGEKDEEAAPAAGAASSDSTDDEAAEEGVWTVAPTDEEVKVAGAIVVPKGVHKDKTLADVAGEEGGATWFLTQLKSVPADAPVRSSFETFVQGRLPDVWAKYEAWKGEQS